MNLVIDVGNTLLKVGVFNGNTLLHKETDQKAEVLNVVKGIKKHYPQTKQAILSSVSHLAEDQIASLRRILPILVLDAGTPMPFINCYDTPETLGVDRLALVAASVQQFSGKNALIIDAGTCITYDFKNDKDEYLGGAIAPGLQLRYRSLHQFTSKLPLLEPKLPDNQVGRSTNEAIHSGIMTGVIHEINGVIEDYCNTYPDLTVILTGGDAHFLSKSLKNSIFATSNFLLEGLNHILVFNSSQ